MLLSPSQPIWSLSLPQAYAALQSQSPGLESAEALRRLERFGANRLPPLKRRPLLLRFTDQLFHFMALLLWVAGSLAFVARAPQLGWAIWAVILINGVFSFWQEYRAERTLEALAGNLPPQVRVWRDGQLQELTADQLVCGDRIVLEEGDRVPADCRVIEAHQLSVDLAVLTGEALPVARDAEPQSQSQPGLPSRERTNLLLAGSTVVSGRGEGLVYATGSETEFGQVAHLTAATARSVSTLEVQIQRIVHTITTIALSTGLLTFLAAVLLERMDPLQSLIYAVGIIVGFVPEGLLPQVTLTLALNVQRMARRQALVRRLSAVETLGSVSVICSDKTGTITQNRMAVEDHWLPQADGELHRLLLLAASLCSNARLEPDRSGGGSEPWRASGDPTETAMLLAAAEAGLSPGEQQRRFPRRRELPFDSHRRRMTVLLELVEPIAGLPLHHEVAAAERLVITKGAPLEVLQRCSAWLLPGGFEPLDQAARQGVVAANDALAGRGFRVIAVAVRLGGEGLQELAPEALEGDLALVGLLGLYDPPRPEVPEAIRQCRQAGIKVTMVTGDYGLTAQAIARQIGLLDPPVAAGNRDVPGNSHMPSNSRGPGHGGEGGNGGADPVRVIEGAMLAQISDVHLRRLLKYRSRLVFARMAPEQKLRLVQAYRDLGEVVAVTGDGVNDAPALRAADVGLAMGRSGTDVAREAADIVLLDDNFATIVEAVRYGRGVVANIRKFITYILVANLAEAMPFVAMVALRIPAALSVMQILAVDLGTDVLPALGLGAEQPDPGLMHRSPRPRGAPLLDAGVLRRSYLFLGLLEAGFAMLAYLLVWHQAGVDLPQLQALAPQLLAHTAPEPMQALQLQASSVAFAAIVLGQVGVLMACRSEWRPSWRLLREPNALLWLGVLSELLLLAALLLIPALGRIFSLGPFPAAWLGPMALAPLLIVLADDARKAWQRRSGATSNAPGHESGPA
ncbi:MAG: cation-translocating P-type ATPase [Cyanobium sp.]